MWSIRDRPRLTLGPIIRDVHFRSSQDPLILPLHLSMFYHPLLTVTAGVIVAAFG